MRKIQVQSIVFRKKENKQEFLLLKRTAEKGGFWQPVSGGMEPEDKTILDTAYRELKEEANIQKKDIIKTLKDVHYFEVDEHYLTNEPIEPIKEYVFGIEIKPETKIRIENNHCNEHEEIKWTVFDEAIKMLKWENNKEGFKKLHKIIR